MRTDIRHSSVLTGRKRNATSHPCSSKVDLEIGRGALRNCMQKREASVTFLRRPRLLVIQIFAVGVSNGQQRRVVTAVPGRAPNMRENEKLKKA